MGVNSFLWILHYFVYLLFYTYKAVSYTHLDVYKRQRVSYRLALRVEWDKVRLAHQGFLALGLDFALLIGSEMCIRARS